MSKERYKSYTRLPTTLESRGKLDSNLTPKLLTYSRKQRENKLQWCVYHM